METARIIIRLVAALTEVVIAAFESGDPAELRKVTDILPKGSTLALDAQLELEREKTRRALEAQG